MMGEVPRFRFACRPDCARAVHCCRREVQVTLSDLERWARDNTLMLVFGHLRLELVDAALPRITLERGEDGVCPLLHREANDCSIAHARPLNCEAYPLGWSGTAYYVMDRSCPGLAAEGMTQPQLEEMRGRAQAEHKARAFTGSVLPVVQALVMGYIEERSRKAMEEMSEEERKRLGEMFQEMARRKAGRRAEGQAEGQAQRPGDVAGAKPSPGESAKEGAGQGAKGGPGGAAKGSPSQGAASGHGAGERDGAKGGAGEAERAGPGRGEAGRPRKEGPGPGKG